MVRWIRGMACRPVGKSVGSRTQHGDARLILPPIPRWAVRGVRWLAPIWVVAVAGGLILLYLAAWMEQ